jgi:hypothetical protein
VRQPSILIVMPYFGQWPEWMDLFLETCRWNPSITWLFLSDALPPARRVSNVYYEPSHLAQIQQLATGALGVPMPIPRAYKICDLRLAFPAMFQEYGHGYDYIGWGDVDVVYGNLRGYLTTDVLDHDIISFNASHLSGHLAVVRNTARARELIHAVPDWRGRLISQEYMHLDEPPPGVFDGSFSILAKESYNTPLSPIIPWRSGAFVFPREWYWSAGRLTNDLDGPAEFPYLHFMHWKGGPWPRECGNAQWERLDRIVNVELSRIHEGFRVNEDGFFPRDGAGAAGSAGTW